MSSGESDTEKRIAEHLAEQDADEQQDAEQVPAGGAGADSGAADAVGVDSTSTASVPELNGAQRQAQGGKARS